jgi:hypothetical protein
MSLHFYDILLRRRRLSHAASSSFITMTAKSIPATDAPAISRTMHATAVTMQHAMTVLYFPANLLTIIAKTDEPIVHNANDSMIPGRCVERL